MSAVGRTLMGRTFVNPAFDYLFIGGGLSLVVTAVVAARGSGALSALLGSSMVLVLFGGNLAHFAASTVRLYTRPGAFRDFRFLTMGLPVVTLAVLALAIRFADALGAHLMNLYYTWSPYHYAAQAYGLALMYAYRSGSNPGDGERVMLRAAGIAPFLYAFVKGPVAGLDWFVPASIVSEPAFVEARLWLERTLGVLTLILPAAVYVASLRRGVPLPLISLLVMVSNATWWTALFYLQAFAWATVFHGLQYMAIVAIFHVRERLQVPGNRRGWAFHAAAFYGACLGLAYFLFYVWPYAFVAAGFGMAESMLLIIAVVNIHHFIVDAYIWRLRRDPNYRIVTGGAPAAPPDALPSVVPA